MGQRGPSAHSREDFEEVIERDELNAHFQDQDDADTDKKGKKKSPSVPASDSGLIVLGDIDGNYWVHHISASVTDTEESVERVPIAQAEITCISALSDSVVCFCCEDALLYDFKQREPRHTIQGGHRDNVTSATTYFSSNSEPPVLCTGGADKKICVWRLAGGDFRTEADLAAELMGHRAAVQCVYSHEQLSFLLLSGSFDNSGRIWDLMKGTQVGVLKGHDDVVATIDGSSDFLVTGSFDESVRLWDSRSFALVNTVEIEETVVSMFYAKKRENAIVVGGMESCFLYDPRNLTGGAVSQWDGGLHLVEVDENRFVHFAGKFLRRYDDGEVEKEFPLQGCCTCLVPQQEQK